MEEEIWKDVKGYEGFYKVSNMGRVKSLEREVLYSNGRIHKYGERILSTFTNKKGYITVCLCKNGVCKVKRLHQVVLSAFYDRPQGMDSINHKDENKANNRLDNLEYCTSEYNLNYGTRAERISRKQINDKNRSTKVCQYTKEGQLVSIYPSIKEAMRQTGADVRRISACCNGYRKTEKGFVWTYFKDDFNEQKRKYRLYLNKLSKTQSRRSEDTLVSRKTNVTSR